jgi:hypothetical protein
MLRRANWVRFANPTSLRLRLPPANLREAEVLVNKFDGGAAAPNQMGSLSVVRFYRYFFENNPMHSSCQLFFFLADKKTRISRFVI